MQTFELSIKSSDMTWTFMIYYSVTIAIQTEALQKLANFEKKIFSVCQGEKFKAYNVMALQTDRGGWAIYESNHLNFLSQWNFDFDIKN